MSISRWLHYLLAFTHRQCDVDVITRSISHDVWIEKLVFSLGNKNLQYMKCIVFYTNSRKFICSSVLLYFHISFRLFGFDCVPSRFMSLACHSWDSCILLSLHHSLTPLRAAHFSEVPRVSWCMRWGEERDEERSKTRIAQQRAMSPWGRDTRTLMTRVTHPFFFTLCLIMSLLMLILPFDALHCINVLSYACSSQTSTNFQILSSIQEMSACGIDYEQHLIFTQSWRSWLICFGPEW